MSWRVFRGRGKCPVTSRARQPLSLSSASSSPVSSRSAQMSKNVSCQTSTLPVSLLTSYDNSFLICGPFGTREEFLSCTCPVTTGEGVAIPLKRRGVEVLAWHMLHFRWWGLRGMNRRGVTLPTLLQIQGHVDFNQFSDIPGGASF